MSEQPREAPILWDLHPDSPLRAALSGSKKNGRRGAVTGDSGAGSFSPSGVREIVSVKKRPVARTRLLPDGFLRGASEPPLPVSKPWSEELERLRGPAHLELDESLLRVEDGENGLDTDRWIAESLQAFEHEMCAPGERGNPKRWLTAVHMRNIFRGAGKIVQSRRNYRAVQTLRAWAFHTAVERKRSKWLEAQVLHAWSEFARDCTRLCRALATRMNASLGPAFKSGLMSKYRKLLAEAEGPSLYHREEHGLYMTVGHVLVLVCRRQLPLRLQSTYLRAWRAHTRRRDVKQERALTFYKESRARHMKHALLFLSRWATVQRTQRAGFPIARFSGPRLQAFDDWLLAKRLRALASRKAVTHATLSRLRRVLQGFRANVLLGESRASAGEEEPNLAVGAAMGSCEE